MYRQCVYVHLCWYCKFQWKIQIDLWISFGLTYIIKYTTVLGQKRRLPWATSILSMEFWIFTSCKTRCSFFRTLSEGFRPLPSNFNISVGVLWSWLKWKQIFTEHFDFFNCHGCQLFILWWYFKILKYQTLVVMYSLHCEIKTQILHVKVKGPPPESKSDKIVH